MGRRPRAARRRHAAARPHGQRDAKDPLAGRAVGTGPRVARRRGRAGAAAGACGRLYGWPPRRASAARRRPRASREPCRLADDGAADAAATHHQDEAGATVARPAGARSPPPNPVPGAQISLARRIFSSHPPPPLPPATRARARARAHTHTHTHTHSPSRLLSLFTPPFPTYTSSRPPHSTPPKLSASPVGSGSTQTSAPTTRAGATT